MKRIKKSIISVVLAVIMLATSCGLHLIASAEKSVNINKALFEAVLNDRDWIIESLVQNDYTNNPYAYVIEKASGQSLLDEVLTNYKNDETFAGLVESMEAYENKGTYATEWIDKCAAVLMYTFGNMTDEELIDYVDNEIKSVDSIKYEEIINAVLCEDYTSSWGTTLFEADSELENYRQLEKILKKLSGYQKALKDNNDILATGYFTDVESFTDYTDNFLSAYEDTLYDALTEIPGIKSAVGDHDVLTKKIVGLSSMAFVLGAETYDPTSKSSSNATASEMSEFYNDWFASDTSAFLKGAGKTLKVGSVAIQYAKVLEALFSQTDTTVAVMNRIGSNSGDLKMRNAMNTFAGYIEEQGDTEVLACDSIINYIKSNGYIGSLSIKSGKKMFEQLSKMYDGYYDANKMVMSSTLCEHLADIGKVAKIGMWVVDKATNIKETARKIYLCKFIQRMIDAAVNTYKVDYQAYQNDATDENAKKCLDDLEFLKKLRLFGEKQSYGATVSQTDSIIGILMGGEQVSGDVEKFYSGNVDRLLGCTLTQTSNVKFNIKKGETLEVQPWPVNDGSTMLAVYTKSDGTKVEFPEADVVLMSSLTLSGGKLMLKNNKFGNFELFLPTVDVSTDSVIEVDGSSVYIGDLNNKNDTALNIEMSNDSELNISNYVLNSGTMSFHGQAKRVTINNLTNSKTIYADMPLTVFGNIDNSGNIFGTTVVADRPSDVLHKDISYYKEEVKTMSGTGEYTDLRFTSSAKEGVKITGKQSVSENISNPSTRLRTSENIVLTGSCAVDGNYVKTAIGLEDYTSSANINFGGTVRILGDVNLTGNCIFNDGLDMTSSAKSLAINGETHVKGDMQYTAGTITGSEWLKLHGNLNVTSSSPTISNLDFVGKLPQTVSSTSEMTVGQLKNNNTSITGITFESKINVTGTLESGLTASYFDGKNVVLTGDAKMLGNTIRGSISAQDWSFSSSAYIKGTFYSSGAIVIPDNVSIDFSEYNQSGGTLTIGKGSSVTCKNNFIGANVTNNGAILCGNDFFVSTLVNNGTIECGRNFKCSGGSSTNGTITVNGDSIISSSYSGGTMILYGDLSASGTLTLDLLHFIGKTMQKYTNSSSAQVKTFTIENDSVSGFTVNGQINVSEKFDGHCNNLINSENVILTGDAFYLQSGKTDGDLTLSGHHTIESEKPMNVNGDLTIGTNADIEIEDGGRLTVEGKLIINNGAKLSVAENTQLVIKKSISASGSTLIVGKNAILQSNDYIKASSSVLTINGDMLIKGDTKLSSTTVGGDGVITFKGDLDSSSCTWNSPDISFISKLPQTVSGSAISVGNLIINNSSKTGFTANTKINYKSYAADSSVVNGNDNLVPNS